ncbi:unnamed protein product [Absidia cylindrospora]
MVNITQIPAEILSVIVQHVGRRTLYECALVNQQFFQAATPVLWQVLQLPNDGALVKVITTMVELRYALGQHVWYVSSGTTALNEKEDGSVDMDIGHRPINNTKFQQLTRQCPNLRSLRLGGSKLTIRSFVFLGKRCRQLATLELNALRCLSSEVLSALSALPLENLDLNVHIFGQESPHWATTQQAGMDLTRFPRLNGLALHGTPHPFLHRFLTTNNIIHRAGDPTSPFPHLSIFVLINCYQLKDEAIIPFLYSQPALKRLILNGGEFTDTLLDAIMTYIPGITHLGLDYTKTITSHGLRRLIKYCSSLVVVRFYGSGIKLTDFPELLDNGVDRNSINDRELGILGEDAFYRIRHQPHQEHQGNKADNNNNNGDEEH